LTDVSGWKEQVARVGSLTIPAGIFIATLAIAWPEWVLSRAYEGGGLVILVAGLVLWLAHLWRGRFGSLLGLAVTLGLFALALAALWQDVAFHYNAIGGLLPWSDAQAYYFDANRLLDGHPLAWSARRPLFPASVAVLLAVTRSLPAALAVMVAMNATAAFLFATEVRRNFGAAAAATATLILFAFYRRNGGAGLVLTENLGFMLGTAAFTALLRGMRLQDLRSYASGAAVLTAALMARAGSFFVLPALAAVALVSLRPGGGRRSTASAVATIGAIAIVAALILTWGRTVSNPAAGHAAFSNYSQPLYGLVVGGKGWGQVSIDHPDAKEGAEIYGLAYEAFRAHPAGLIKGMARMAHAYLWPTEPYHAFSFIEDGSRTKLLQATCYVLALVGLGACVWRWRDPVHALILAVAAGHLASIPFVPPIDAGLRVYAATTPALALLVAAGIAFPRGVLTALRRDRANGTAPSPIVVDAGSRLNESAALILVAIVMGSSWALYALGRPTTFLRPSCPSGSESLVVRMNDDEVLRIDEDRAPRGILPTVIRQRELQRTAGAVEMKTAEFTLGAGMSFLFTYDPMDGREVWLVGESARLQTSSGLLQICGHYGQDKTARYYGLMLVDEAWVTGPGRSR
jgi:hypothetical protein